MNGITINPFLTTTQLGSFSTQSNGYIQGMSMSDPSIRNWLSGGIIAEGQTKPMYGGVGIFEDINAGSVLGGTVGYATLMSNLTGFSVFDQSTSWVNTPQSPVSLGTSGQTASFYRLGSMARIPLEIDPSLISLNGGLITQTITWDFHNQRIVGYDPYAPTIAIVSMTATTVLTTATIDIVAVAPTVVGGIGDAINISGATNAGTGGNTIVNGDFIVTGFTDNRHFSIQIPVANSGVITTIAGTPILNQTVGILNVRILDIQVGNSMTVVYDPLTGRATWNKQSACALVEI